MEEVTPIFTNSYFLVVPLNANDEGGYGNASGSPRPRGATTCRVTQELTCP